jgi:hypothetical protein
MIHLGGEPRDPLSGAVEQVFRVLYRMDQEADTLYPTGNPTGLHDYGKHARPEQKRPQTEPNWTKRLSVLLPARAIPTTPEVHYPDDSGCKCDLVVSLPGGVEFWLEIKGAWKQWWIENGSDWIYRSYFFHPLVPGLDPKTHTVPLDLEKLRRLRPPHATHVGSLLVAFDSESAPVESDVAELVRLAGLASEPWTTDRAWWPDARRPGRFVKCWLWRRCADRSPL